MELDGTIEGWGRNHTLEAEGADIEVATEMQVAPMDRGILIPSAPTPPHPSQSSMVPLGLGPRPLPRPAMTLLRTLMKVPLSPLAQMSSAKLSFTGDLIHESPSPIGKQSAASKDFISQRSFRIQNKFSFLSRTLTFVGLEIADGTNQSYPQKDWISSSSSPKYWVPNPPLLR